MILFLHLFKISIRPGWVERFVGPHKSHQFFRIGKINDVVRITGNHFHDLYLFPADLKIDYFIRSDLTKPDQAMTAHHHEFLILGMMPVLAFRYPRFGDID